MAWTIERAPAADRDLALILDHLYTAALAFGEDEEGAMNRAAARLRMIRDAMKSFALAPHQGTLRPDLAPGLRQVTKGRAVFYFTLDESTETIRVLAIFFGGQDHHGRILLRLLSPET